MWRSSNSSRGGPHLGHASGLESVSVADLQTLCLDLESPMPTIAIYLSGGKAFGTFQFTTGCDCAVSFLVTLRIYAEIVTLKGAFNDGDLLAVEARPRAMVLEGAHMQAAANEPGAELGYEDWIALQKRPLQEAELTRNGTGDRKASSKIVGQFLNICRAAGNLGRRLSSVRQNYPAPLHADSMRRGAVKHRAFESSGVSFCSSSSCGSLDCFSALGACRSRGVPLSSEVWKQSFDYAGRMTEVSVIMRAIFLGGIEDNLRSTVWPFLLGFFEWDSSSEQRNQTRLRKRAEYEALKRKWAFTLARSKQENQNSLSENPRAVLRCRRERLSKSSADCLEVEERVAKDIVRTDRILQTYYLDESPAMRLMGIVLNVYGIHNTDILYCQGMSDFLSPLIVVLGIDDEALVFWCFVGLMRRVERNFRMDESGMLVQLSKLKKLVSLEDQALARHFEQSDPNFHSCYRWILTHFKRELPFGATLRLWDALWTQDPDGDLHIFIAASLLIRRRKEVMSSQNCAFDGLVRYLNGVGAQIDVDHAIRVGYLCSRKYNMP